MKNEKKKIPIGHTNDSTEVFSAPAEIIILKNGKYIRPNRIVSGNHFLTGYSRAKYEGGSTINIDDRIKIKIINAPPLYGKKAINQYVIQCKKELDMETEKIYNKYYKNSGNYITSINNRSFIDILKDLLTNGLKRNGLKRNLKLRNV